MTAYLSINKVAKDDLPATMTYPVVSINTIGSYSTPQSNYNNKATVTPYASITLSTTTSTVTLDTEELDMSRLCKGCGSPFHSFMEKK